MRQFASEEEFRAWWESPEISRVRRDDPGQLDFLKTHPFVKSWLDKLNSRELKTFGKYQLEKKLGQGGMGAVYLAYDATLNRRVALKTLILDDPESVERFLREARATAKLKHPNIINVHEVGTEGGTHYLTMDYVQGKSMGELIHEREPSLTHKRVSEIIHDIGRALEYAHGQGIIHRDIKPSNILIDPSGKAFLTDFGLAKELTATERSLTVTGTVLGTPEYMSPEQASGKKKEIGTNSDIFSLGATFYHGLTGQTPFPGEDVYQLISDIINKDPLPPRKVIGNIHKDLETICMKCLEKEPQRRYKTAGELADDIKRYLDGEEILAKPSGPMSRAWKRVRKNRVASLSLLGIFALGIGISVWQIVNRLEQANLIKFYRQEALDSFQGNRYEDALAACQSVLMLVSEDDEISQLQKKCKAILQEQKQLTAEQIIQAQQADELRAKANAVLERESFVKTPEEKIAIAQDALKIDPLFGKAYQVIGYVYKGKKDYDRAYDYFSKAIEATPSLVYAYYERGWITNYIRSKPDESIADFNKVLELDPNSYIGWLVKGNIENSKKNYDQALASYSRAIELYPQCDLAYYQRGYIYLRQGDMARMIADHDRAFRLNPEYLKLTMTDLLGQEAIEYYEALIKLNPNLGGLYNNLGTLYFLTGQDIKALDAYDRAVKLGYSDFNLFANAGQMHLTRGLEAANENDKKLAKRMFRTSAELYLKSISVNSNNRKTFRDLARTIFTWVKVFDDKTEMADICQLALDACNQVLKGGTIDAEIYIMRGKIWGILKNHDRAIEDFTRVIDMNDKGGNAVMAYNERGIAYSEKKDFTKAVFDFSRAITLSPDNPGGYLNRASIYEKLNQMDQAIDDYTQVIKLAPETHIYNSRGVCYGKKRMYAQAIADFTESIRLDQSFGTFINRAYVYIEINDYDKAIADCNYVLEQDKENISGYLARADAYSAKRQYDKALPDVDWVINKFGGEWRGANLYRSRGTIHFELGNWDNAIIDLTNGIKMDSKDSRQYFIRSAAYAKKAYVEKGAGRIEDFRSLLKNAISDVETGAKIEPDSPFAIFPKSNLEGWKKALSESK